ncbi:MAG TPA: FAD-binding oxidoreductase [Aquella sp.]|nr:FAD-binding oxidoreductase [Aquella sp.]
MKNDLLAKLLAIVGEDYIITDPKQQQTYLTDWRGRYVGQAVAIVKPQTKDQIVELVKLCQIDNINIIPQGGNTSLSGGATPLNQSSPPQIIFNFSCMNKILEIDAENNSITVEAGCTLAQIIAAADAHNRYFPLKIASLDSCQIGGNIATNAGGIHVIKYGMMRDMVLGLEVVLADGRILNGLNSLRKNNSYLDLKQLFIGSEGTLGIITQAVLKLYPKPTDYVTGLIGVKTISQAINLLNQLSVYFSVCTFEIVGKNMQDIYNANFSINKLPLSDDWVILFELETNNVDGTLDLLSKYDLDTKQLIISDNLASRRSLWQMRENLPEAEKMHGVAIKHDISLPISKIEQFIKLNEKNIRKRYPEAQIIIFGHLGDGNLHYNVQLSTQENTIASEKNINQIVYADVLKLGGSISAEHGIGQLKPFWYKQSTDPVSYDLARHIKKLLDPKNLFNSNKIFNKD